MTWDKKLEDLSGELDDLAVKLAEIADNLNELIKKIEWAMEEAEEKEYDRGFNEGKKESE